MHLEPSVVCFSGYFQFWKTLDSIEIVSLEAKENCDFIGYEDFQSLN